MSPPKSLNRTETGSVRTPSTKSTENVDFHSLTQNVSKSLSTASSDLQNNNSFSSKLSFRTSKNGVKATDEERIQNFSLRDSTRQSLERVRGSHIVVYFNSNT